MVVLKSILMAAFAAFAVAESNEDDAYFENLELFWSYGRSESVLPSPEGEGLGEWADFYAQAKEIVSNMTLEEKENLTSGFTSTQNGCSGVLGSIERFDIPEYCFQDAGNGVRSVELASAFPAGIHAGASFNKALTRERAVELGAEFKRKGVAVALGPVVGPIGKIALGGRNWEGFGNDPYLAGVLGAESVEGMQENVVACLKHFIGNEQETMRNPPFLLEDAHNQSVSNNIDDKLMHELYLWPFQDSVKAGVGSVMVSYNKLNNSYATQNSKIMNGLLKTELGFQGFAVSDWGAQHAGLASWEAGLDLAMASSDYFGNITVGINNGTFDESRLDDMAVRILATMFRYTEKNATGDGIPIKLNETHKVVDARSPSSKPVLFQGAVEGQVLVKNEGALPLDKPKIVSVFGYDAVAAATRTYNTDLGLMGVVGFENVLSFENGTDVDLQTLYYMFLSSADPHAEGPGNAYNGTLFCGGGSGANSPSYIDAPLDAIKQQVKKDGTQLFWDVSSPEPAVFPDNDACIVFINAFASEGMDRPHLRDDYSDALVENVASKCSNTIVVIHNAGIRLVDTWYDHENVTAIIYAHLPGQDSGSAIVEVLYGNQSPSGRLPYTVAKNESDYGDLLNPIFPQDDSPYYAQDNETAGIYIDYKHFIKNDIEPRFPFGFGLTYTNFSYSDLQVNIVDGVDTGYYPPSDEIVEGGVASLWDVVANVTVTITNTGSVEAAEVPQLYVGIPEGPEKVLRGFEKESIKPDESATISFQLTRRDLSSWSVADQKWVLQDGDYDIYVGKDVLDIQLQDTLSISN